MVFVRPCKIEIRQVVYANNGQEEILFFKKGQGKLVFCSIPFIIAAVAFDFFLASLFADFSGYILLLLLAKTVPGLAVYNGDFF